MRYLLLWAALVLPFSVFAAAEETPGLAADTVEHDFGVVVPGGTCRTEFLVRAEAAAVVILSAETNCGCTKAAYPKKPLRRGDTATVAVTFEAEQKGYFRKTVTLTYHANGGTHALPLTVKGNVR